MLLKNIVYKKQFWFYVGKYYLILFNNVFIKFRSINVPFGILTWYWIEFLSGYAYQQANIIIKIGQHKSSKINHTLQNHPAIRHSLNQISRNRHKKKLHIAACPTPANKTGLPAFKVYNNKPPPLTNDDSRPRIKTSKS